jgi:cold shock CspA family protein
MSGISMPCPTTTMTPSNSAFLRSFSTAVSEPYLTGTVKFYLRNKAYGFLEVDSADLPNGEKEVFVHRSSFVTEHSMKDGFVSRPFLNEGERVRFRLEPNNNKDNVDNKDSAKKPTMRATEVTFEDGRQIPLYRKNYAMSVVRSELLRFGSSVVQIMESNDADSSSGGSSLRKTDAELLQEIRESLKEAKAKMEVAQVRQEKYGVPGH